MIEGCKWMAIKYFAYGSNLDLPQMKRRCPSSKLISKGTLPGYRLTFNRFSSGWGGGVADVIQEQDSKVGCTNFCFLTTV